MCCYVRLDFEMLPQVCLCALLMPCPFERVRGWGVITFLPTVRQVHLRRVAAGVFMCVADALPSCTGGEMGEVITFCQL